MLTEQRDVVVNRGRSCLAAVLLRAVASPNDSFRLAVGNHVLVAVVQEHFAPFRRLGEDQLLLAELLAADDFLQDLRDMRHCGKEEN